MSLLRLDAACADCGRCDRCENLRGLGAAPSGGSIATAVVLLFGGTWLLRQYAKETTPVRARRKTQRA